jgi:hypothetical protein
VRLFKGCDLAPTLSRMGRNAERLYLPEHAGRH